MGDVLNPMAKGPLTTTDMIVFHAGGYGFVPYEPCANRIAYKNRQRIAPFYVKNEYGIPDVAQRVHWDNAWAQAIGNPMAYDYGVMRDCWLSHFMTDYIGDDGWLVSQSSEIRKFNYIGDTHVLTGEVVDKRQEDGRCVVDIEMRGTNQRDTVTCPAKATVRCRAARTGRSACPIPRPSWRRRRCRCSSATTRSWRNGSEGDRRAGIGLSRSGRPWSLRSTRGPRPSTRVLIPSS